LKSPIQSILNLASQDDDEWVRVIAYILPILLSEDSQVINSEIPNEVFNKTKKELLEFISDHEAQFYPLETPYLSPSIILDGNSSPPSTENPHFHLKKPLSSLSNSNLSSSVNDNISEFNEEGEFGYEKEHPLSTSTPSLNSSVTRTSSMESLKSKSSSSFNTKPMPKSNPFAKKKMQMIDIQEVQDLTLKAEKEKSTILEKRKKRV